MESQKLSSLAHLNVTDDLNSASAHFEKLRHSPFAHLGFILVGRRGRWRGGKKDKEEGGEKSLDGLCSPPPPFPCSLNCSSRYAK